MIVGGSSNCIRNRDGGTKTVGAIADQDTKCNPKCTTSIRCLDNCFKN
jgi:hypothetical protein